MERVAIVYFKINSLFLHKEYYNGVTEAKYLWLSLTCDDKNSHSWLLKTPGIKTTHFTSKESVSFLSCSVGIWKPSLTNKQKRHEVKFH